MIEKKFAFGKNWQEFLNCLNAGRFQAAQESLTQFLGRPDLKNLSFLDIGCGSGLFSQAAYRLGARQIISFDADPFSVQCCQHLHKESGQPANWKIFQGSILDERFLKSLGTFDIVYSWGVLHHTGAMWQAIRNSASLVNPQGFYYIAIYNNKERFWGSLFWLRIKKFYNHSARWVQWLMENFYCLGLMVRSMLNMQNPFSFIKNYQSHRGMSFKRDAVDWVGGYPYEFATVEEIFQFMKEHYPAFKLVNLKSTNSFGNNWFLFQRES